MQECYYLLILISLQLVGNESYTYGSAASRLVFLAIVCSLPHLLVYLSSLLSDLSRLERRRFLLVGTIDCGAISHRPRRRNGSIGDLARIAAAVSTRRVVVGAMSASQLPPPSLTSLTVPTFR